MHYDIQFSACRFALALTVALGAIVIDRVSLAASDNKVGASQANDASSDDK